MKLSELKNGETAVIVRLSGHGGFRKRIMEMGFIRGEKVTSVLDSPMHDPIKYNVMGYEVLLRRNEAAMIEVLPEEDAKRELSPAPTYNCISLCDSCATCNGQCATNFRNATERRNVINVALVGNPNSGKTSIFNALANKNEHVGNYSGVTVDAKTGSFNYKGYRINLTDLPGTYSIAAYSPEEIYVRRHLYEQMPDIIINSVVASNLERNLYLTTELIDMNIRSVVALNMYDELLAKGAEVDYVHLGAMMGVPMIPTVARNNKGLDKLLDTVIELFEGKNNTIRHIHINYGSIIEEQIAPLSASMHKADDLPQQFPVRYWALKLLENDKEALRDLDNCLELPKWKSMAEEAAKKIQAQMGVDAETAINGAKYGFINGALQETYTPGEKDTNRHTRRIDRLVANRWLGFPIFIFVMWAMFSSVFLLGAYPQEWIEKLFTWLGEGAANIIPQGAIQDLVVNGIISGIGSVAVFIPQILILYLFISLMEDSGYMARAAFIMDRLMHKMGLHGKSFIPMLMGFGCNVPAIMATRTIESRSSRIITVLITPFMSCSARLPVLILFAGAFFPQHAALVLMGLYLLGIVVAIITARLLRLAKFHKDETPFVMELPPYRWPTLRATLRHMWEKCAQYIKKIGTVILLSTVVIWFLSYYPRPNETERSKVKAASERAQSTSLLDAMPSGSGLREAKTENVMLAPISETEMAKVKGENVMLAPISETEMAKVKGESFEQIAEEETISGINENSFIAMLGHAVEPMLAPIGQNWRSGIALITSIPAKELVVSTLGVLYSSDSDESITEDLKESGDFTPRSAAAFLVFILLFFPCIATIAAISHETGSWKWALFSIIYNTAVAWVAAFIVYTIGGLL
ncbi:MAG: ferrous iron transport protein B [Bacteroidaceae bacterium]|nr:ferrous iron transport protein B [Bacteroidaceae bacterium]